MKKTIIERECIRCGLCVEVCPKLLCPSILVKYYTHKKYDDLDQYRIDLCIECGACTKVCPANIPITNYIKNAKSEIAQRCYIHNV